MITCVAEKPSVGQYIAKILGANTRRDGYYEGNGYFVTWTIGHLCALLDPNEYNEQWKGWTLGSLPMIPDRFGIKVTENPGIQKQFNVIKSLIAQSERVINCGDAGQEGELIQRWVYQKAGCKVPVDRLWVNSLTEEAIVEGFKNLKPQENYQRLYEAGLLRAIGDWLLGMNATRVYTVRYAQGVGRDRQVLSVGRVQTPTLALIVNRQEEIEHFVPRTYWELKTEYRGALFSAQLRDPNADEDPAQDKDKKDERPYAPTKLEDWQALVDSIKDQPMVITSVEKKKAKEFAPYLFDLTSLQVECNKKYSFSADQTLQLIQNLYEKRITTYPRVDTTYLPDDIYPKVPATLRGISDYYPAAQRVMGLKADGGKGPTSLPKSKKVFDNKKVTDHHAIIPTGVRPDNLSADERKVFDLVALRFIAAFYPECEVSNTTVLGEVEKKGAGVLGVSEVSKVSEVSEAPSSKVVFKVTGREVLSPGWREVFENEANRTNRSNRSNETNDTNGTNGSDESGDQPEETKTLPSFVKGESGPHTPKLVEKTTQPPKYYTEATLLRAMETAGKTVENEELREAMKENGIGRPSTRASIIEKLYQRKYIVLKGKSIHATETGINLIHTIISPLLKSAELTGLWEKKLRDIEAGTYTSPEMLAELKEMTKDVVRQVKTNRAGQICPVCGQGRIIRGNTRYGCSRWRQGCTFQASF